MEIGKILKLAEIKLIKKRIDSPALEAEILLSKAINKERSFLLAHSEKKLTGAQKEKFELLIKRRIKGEPVAYILGEKEFYGLRFYVNKNVLIPRPETEIMVDEVIKHITHNMQHITSEKNIIADIGTGSGCILISVIKKLENIKFPLVNYEFAGIDISGPALAVARKNAKFHKVEKRINFLKGDLLTPILKKISEKSQVVITANLPYLSKKWENQNNVYTKALKFEPKIALYAGSNGLELYAKLFKQINELLSLKKIKITLYCEFDPRQSFEIKKLAQSEFPNGEINIIKDFCGRNRFLKFEN